MGFFKSNMVEAFPSAGGLSVETLHQLRCRACPLDRHERQLQHPKMIASGASAPDLYVLGEAPGATEDKEGVQFVGVSGKLLRSELSLSGIDRRYKVRWNNTLRCRPPSNREPLPIETECCRNFIVDDIVKTKPKVILGTGNVPLRWMVSRERLGRKRMEGITTWTGRLMPVNVGGHECWYYPVMHPSAIIRHGGDYDRSSVWKAFRLDLEKLRGLMRSLPIARVWTREEAVKDIELIHDVKRVRKALREMSQERLTGLDVETFATPMEKDLENTALHPQAPNAKILTAAISAKHRTIVFPLAFPKAWSSSERSRIDDAFLSYLKSSGIKVAHNLVYELSWLEYFYGKEIVWPVRWADTMGMAYALDERKGMLSLGVQTLLAFGLNIKTLSYLNMSALDKEPLEDVLQYNGTDSKFTRKLAITLMPRLKHEGLLPVYTMLVRAAKAIAQSQNQGIKVNVKRIDRFADELEEKHKGLYKWVMGQPVVKTFEKKIKKKFNPASNKDLAVLFGEILGRKEVKVLDKKTGVVKVSTDEKVLSQIKLPIAKHILDLRGHAKLRKTYLIGTRRVVFPDGLLHPGVNLLLTSTGRLSYEEPNMQNFPKRDASQLFVRGIIVARSGCYLLAVDYGQIEARVIAMASEDTAFVEAFWTGFDIHGHWAKIVLKRYPKIKDWVFKEFSATEESWFKQLRNEMKNRWVFPLFYGASFVSTGTALMLPERLAKDMYLEFWSMFPGVRRWQNRTRAFYDRHGYVETLTGRRRHGPIDGGRIINSPIQGTAADIVTDAFSELAEHKLVANFQVHDDIVWDCREDRLDRRVKAIAKIMCTPRFDFINVPIVVEMSKGKRWDKMKEFAKFDSYKDFGLPVRQA